MKKVAILQSNYIPWRGYFDLINRVDDFVLYDDAQYTKNDWRNRNKIKTSAGLSWLTIPVRQQCLSQRIRDTKITDVRWSRRHWKTLTQNYSKSRFFTSYNEYFEDIYNKCTDKYLTEINYKFLKAVNDILDIKTNIKWSSDFVFSGGSKSEKLVDICKSLQANVYISGPSAKNYLDEELFEKEGIAIEWMSYDHYMEYEQLHPPFENSVTVLDLIFNCGPDSKRLVTGVN